MRRLVIPLLLAAACADSGTDGAGGSGAGGSAPLLPLELQIVRWEDGSLLPVAEGSSIPLVKAPQGGYFVWVAARVKNLTGRDVDMSAVAEDAATGAAIGAFVARPLMTRAADGFFDPEHETFTTLDMVQLCPRGVGLDLDGRLVKLTLQVKDVKSKQTGTASVQVRPDCGGNAGCLCECAADYSGTCG